jgi:hypothetical protein
MSVWGLQDRDLQRLEEIATKKIMNFFSKTKKINALLRTCDLVLEFDCEHGWWSFEFEGVDFVSSGAELNLPERDQLNSIVVKIHILEEEMVRRIKAGLHARSHRSGFGEYAEYTVDVAKFANEGFFEVTWSSKDWGDLGIDFGISNDSIVSEGWSD